MIYTPEIMKDLDYKAFKKAMDNNAFSPLEARTFQGIIDGKVISGHYIENAIGEKIIYSWWFDN